MIAGGTATELIERVLVTMIAQSMMADSETCALVYHSCMQPINDVFPGTFRGPLAFQEEAMARGNGCNCFPAVGTLKTLRDGRRDHQHTWRVQREPLLWFPELRERHRASELGQRLPRGCGDHSTAMARPRYISSITDVIVTV